jgi:carbon-monoxide dehydrogenase medium subunit
LSEIATSIAKDMNPIDSHQGRGETKRRQAAVLLKRTLKDMIVRAAHV